MRLLAALEAVERELMGVGRRRRLKKYEILGSAGLFWGRFAVDFGMTAEGGFQGGASTRRARAGKRSLKAKNPPDIARSSGGAVRSKRFLMSPRIPKIAPRAYDAAALALPKNARHVPALHKRRSAGRLRTGGLSIY